MNSRILGALGVSLVVASLHAQRVDTVLSTNLSEPRGITSDGSAIYIADSGNNRILKYTQEGVMTVLAGKSGISGAGYNDDLGTRALFNDPQGIVYSAARGGLIVADYGNSAIRFVNLTSRQVSTIGGVGQQDGYWDGGLGTSLYSFPSGVDLDPNTGNVYVADFGNGVVRMLDGANNTSTYVDLNAASPSGVSTPTAVAVGRPGELWVADSYNNVVWLVVSNASGMTVTNVAGQFGNRGTNDADVGIQGRLSEPWGLLWRGWLGADADLIVSDSGNNTLRRVFTNTSPDVLAYSLATFSGTPGIAGSVDDVVPFATFNRPMGLGGVPASGSFYIADSASGRIRLYSDNTLPVTKVADPKIGYVTYTVSSTGQVIPAFNDLTGTSKTFDNIPLIVCMGPDNALVHVTFGAGSLSSIPNPTVLSSVIKLYPSGATVDQVPQGLPCSPPDMFVKAIAEKSDGSPPSTTVHAEFKFQVASPIIIGKNAASLVIVDSTTNSTMYYTLDGTEPTTNSTVLPASPVTIPIAVDTTLKVKAFDAADGFTPSETSVLNLKASDYQANQLNWGFASGEGSSLFIGSPGQTFYAPVSLVVVPGQSVYSFQFDAWITRETSEPGPAAYDYTSYLLQALDVGYIPLNQNQEVKNLAATNLYSVDITNALGQVTNSETVVATNLSVAAGIPFATITHTNYLSSLELGYLARHPETNILYNTTRQDLVDFSSAHETLFDRTRIILGTVSFKIPASITDNVIYQIQLQNPSGADISGLPITMQVLTNGSLGAGSANSIKQITNGSIKYLVGSVVPFRWFNAGEFGSSNIANADVIQVFDAVNYGLSVPPQCDMLDAMDSARQPLNSNWANTPQAEIESINSMTQGDGVIDFRDLYVTYRRSLDPSLFWYNHYWTNGAVTSEQTPNLLATPNKFLRKSSSTAALRSSAAQTVADSGPHSLTIRGTDLVASSQTIAVPINAEVIGDAPIRTFLMNIKVVALDGSPEIADPISFWETDNLASPNKLTASRAPNNLAGAWLDSTVDGVTGSNQLGVLLINLPPGANSDSAYMVHFDRFAASPNGLTMFPTVVEDTLVTLRDRSASSWNDTIPDAWRLRYFGTISNLLSAANADADGDGVSNLQEYQAGTSPVDALSKPQPQQPNPPTLGLIGVHNDPVPTFTLQWDSQAGHTYIVETSPDVLGTNWTVLSTNLPGTGSVTQFSDTNATGATKFYRVRAQ